MGWNWIDEIIINLKKKYLTNSPYEICKILKIKIERVNPHYYLLANKKSIYFRDFYGNQIIFIRNDLYGKEEEFLLRHELGHAILHPNIPNSKHINTGKIDKQANYFALILSNISFDNIKFREMTLAQISSCTEIPFEALSQLVNL